VNTSRRSRKLISARIRAPHGGWRHGVAVTRGTRLRRGERGKEMGAACSLPHRGAVMMVRGRRLAVLRWCCGGAGARLTAALSPVERQHGSARRAVAAEGECERAAGAKKRGWGGLGVRVAGQRIPHLPRTRCGLT
jgi:hypothetical protein